MNALPGGAPQKKPRDTDPAGKPGLEARQVAAKMLAAIVDRKTSMDGLFDPENGNAAYRALPDADRGLVRAIVITALRHLPVIEAFLAEMLEKPLPEGARSLQHVLTAAAAQILFLDVPDRAAVDLAVEQATRDPRSRRFANLVNALLRRMAREKETVLPRLQREVDCAPDWFAERLRAVYGSAHARAILAAQTAEAPLDLTIKSDPAGWAERLGGIVLPTGTVRLGTYQGSVADLPGYGEGAWWVQDAAASIPARLFGKDLSGQKIADLCAAPGGKTAQLAMLGADVTAFDLSENRLKRLKGNLDRLGLSANCVAGDFQKTAPPGAFDAVLLDAPCSSTGTVRRHPDVPWTKGPEDVRKLAALQEKMLRNAVALVKPGGTIVFSNCSLDPLEGEEVVARVLADTPDLRRRPVEPADWPGLEAAISDAGDFRSTPAMLPNDDPRLAGLDGFYAAVLVRSS